MQINRFVYSSVVCVTGGHTIWIVAYSMAMVTLVLLWISRIFHWCDTLSSCNLC